VNFKARIAAAFESLEVDEAEQIEPTIGSSPAGAPPIREISADPLASVHTSRSWGVAIRHPDGSVDLQPDPWEA
jgi:hypothetical protein